MSLLKSGLPIKTCGRNLAGLWRPSIVKIDQRLFVFGGGGNVSDDLHVFNIKDMRWETITTRKGTVPCKRYGHTASRWNNSIVIFGGCNEYQEYCDDVHVFDLESMTWYQPSIKGSVPPRYLHSSVIYDNKMFIYGGFAKSSECTFVLDELNVLDLETMTWSTYHDIPPRYNHSATLVGHKMYIYGGKDESGNTVSDLFVVNLQSPPYTPRLLLKGSKNTDMVLLKSQHFCDAICGKLFVFGRFLSKVQMKDPEDYGDSAYALWVLDLDTLEWERQDCDAHFHSGGWNYFTIISETISTHDDGQPRQAGVSSLLFLGNTDPYRPQGYDHFRDALVINGEALGLYDIAPPRFMSEFAHMLNNPELSDFMVVPSDGQAIHVHQIILMTRWPHFRDMYKSGLLDSQQRRIEFSEPYNVVLAFLKYLYSDRLDEREPWEVVCKLLVVAKVYMQYRLKKMCCERLYQRHLSVESCGMILEKSIIADEPGLKLLALDFMFRNYGLVLKSNMLMHVPPSVQQAFLDAVPEHATLDVGHQQTQLQRFGSKCANAIYGSAGGGLEPSFERDDTVTYISAALGSTDDTHMQRIELQIPPTATMI